MIRLFVILLVLHVTTCTKTVVAYRNVHQALFLELKIMSPVVTLIIRLQQHPTAMYSTTQMVVLLPTAPTPQVFVHLHISSTVLETVSLPAQCHLLLLWTHPVSSLAAKMSSFMKMEAVYHLVTQALLKECNTTSHSVIKTIPLAIHNHLLMIQLTSLYKYISDITSPSLTSIHKMGWTNLFSN